MNIEKIKAEIRRDVELNLLPNRSAAGRWICGYGRDLQAKGSSEEEVLRLEEAGGITEELADRWLLEDIHQAVRLIRKSVPAFESLSGVRQRALINIAYSQGDRFSGMKRMLEAIDAGDFNRAAEELLKSKWARLVGSRAKRLARMLREDRADDGPMEA